LRATLITLSFVLSAAGLCSAADITYNVNRTVGAGSVTGDIITDGTLGVLGQANIVNETLLINDGTSTFTIQGSNSQDALLGADLSATATQLSFNFSGSDTGVLLFQSPTIGSNQDFVCFQTGPDCGGTGAGDLLLVANGSAGQFAAEAGTQVIGTAGTSSVPEPATLALLGAGIGLLGFRKATKKRPRL
jgi:hypothetical protein